MKKGTSTKSSDRIEKSLKGNYQSIKGKKKGSRYSPCTLIKPRKKLETLHHNKLNSAVNCRAFSLICSVNFWNTFFIQLGMNHSHSEEKEMRE
jgi:hypothetical protein